MAGDWIPMRTDLWDCPEVVRILSAMCPDSVLTLSESVRIKSTILGAMYRTWSLFDTYTDDGILHGYSANTLDSLVGIDGWTANLQHVGWLIVEAQSLTMPRFSTWLSSSAKARLKDAQRKRNEREKTSEFCPKSVRKSADRNRTTGEKRTGEKRRIEEIHTPSPSTAAVASASATQKKSTAKPRNGEPDGFSEWYAAYPRHEARGSAAKAYERAVKAFMVRDEMDRQAAVKSLLEVTLLFADSDAGKAGSFTPQPASWLNGARYFDDPSAWSRKEPANGKPRKDYSIPQLKLD